MNAISTISSPNSRAHDPDSSHDAGEEATNSGRRQTQAEKVLDCLNQYPGATSMELAEKFGLDRYMVARRLADLKNASPALVESGTSRICSISHKKAVPWYPEGVRVKRPRNEIYCCSCEIKITARLTDGSEIYPHRTDLSDLPFWKCDSCGNHVGCHHKTNDPTRPLGCIPTPEITKARKHIHELLDPLWKSGKIKRNRLYKELSSRIGWKYHTAKIRSIEEARDVYRLVQAISKEINTGELK